jgi:hydroxymethylglutaryl-CoA reductase
MSRSSRIPGFYTRAIDERRRLVAERSDCAASEITRVLAAGGLDPTTADKTIENVLGTYALPFSVALNFRVNERDHLVPMVIEEPSVVAAASNAARMVREGGGFRAEADAPWMIAQVQLWDVDDASTASERITAHTSELLAKADASVPGLVARGGGARCIRVRDLGDGLLVVHIVVDVCDAMGANLANTVAEALGPTIARLAGGTAGLQILSNLSDDRCVRVEAKVPTDVLGTESMRGDHVRDRIVAASRFAERDPYRAATHNKGMMNGIDAVVMATGNDWRAVEAGAHAFAARGGHYAPLATWREGDDGSLVGRLELPLALGTVGGTLRVHPAARLALRLLAVSGSQQLAMVAASVGLASNLAALRALATEGIQRGHMSLHARSVATAAGATGDEVDRVAESIAEARDVTVEGARRALARMRNDDAREASRA